MATKSLFKSATSSKSRPGMVKVKPVNTVNNAGGVAYALSNKAALCQGNDENLWVNAIEAVEL